jgi:hypothetical protein
MEMIVEDFDGTLQLLNVILIKCEKIATLYRECNDQFIEQAKAEYAAKSPWRRMFVSPRHVDNSAFSIYVKWPMAQFKQDAKKISNMISKMVTINSEVGATFIFSEDEISLINKYMRIDFNEEKAKLLQHMTQLNQHKKD